MRQAESEAPLNQFFYLFINTKSGNRQGKRIMEYRHLDLQAYIPSHIHLHFIDLFDADSRITSIHHLKKAADQERVQTKVIVCGGDGTINWVINELVKHEVDLAKSHFGVIPIGTGNDFCRAIGWQVETFDFSFQNFILLLQKWMRARICKYDIWDVSIQTYKDGKILDVKDRIEVEREEKTIKKAFTNYVGIGIDARVTYTVQKIRTPYTCINKMLYACVGFINLFRPIKYIKRKIASFTQNASNSSSISYQETTTNWLEDEMKSTKAMETDRKDNMIFSIKSKYKGLVCLNSTSYIAGLRNVWKTKAIATETPNKEFQPQTVGDGNVEFVAFKNELALGLQRLLRSGAKFTQGTGPFEMLFKPTEANEITYLQIDGESLKVVNLKSIRIAKTESITGHQINIMAGQAQ